ncbi:DHA2 family efflux MFS transporter permease subunit [Planomonospora sp. ID67723]|uniref:DHA2 family efflux MFS transporter permease subunit n=1 Tax=Planomonospora sp. ID67723 TaxID=2738134 RepID=UPI0018C3AC6A|nr:DHA2 family efflux MFS transporter permease subunit [Planomonospora sp. ID67723]MBG0831000.1 DHA2 family efflux MFS transporter permease subunit [Planomonospora sp. ID67723]
MTHTVGTGSPAVTAEPYRWRWLALFVILAAEVMDLVDAVITNIAAPSIHIDLGGSTSMIQWLGAGYTMAMAVGLITGGRLGDLYGRKRMFVIGALGFTAASLLCGLAVSSEMLIASRVLQGLFGAVMIPQGLGMIKEMFPPKEMAAAFGVFGPVMALSMVAGPVLAGWLVDADLFGTGWRMIFLINLPVGLFALVGAARFLPESRPGHAARLDLTGMGLVSAASFLLIYPLVQGRDLDWPAWTFASMAASAAVFALFARHQAGKRRAGGDPLVVTGLFRKRAFSGGLVTGLVFFTALVGFSMVISLYFQIGLGYDPLQAGLASLPNALGSLIGFAGVNAAGLAQKVGRRLIHLGAVVMAAGLAGIAVTLDLAGVGVTPWQLAPAMFVTGAGMSMVMAPFFDIVLAGVEPHESGSASGTLTAVQQLGGALGSAAIGTLFFGLLERGRAFPDVMQTTVWVTAGLVAVAFAAAFLLPLRARPEEGAGH